MRFLSVIVGLMIFQIGRAAEPVEMKGYLTSALSPDGETLVFEWLNDLWLAPSKGGAAKRLVEDAARDAYPRFSADGKRLVFSSERSGSLQIYSVKLDGTDLLQHSDHTEGNSLEDVSPDGSYALAKGLRAKSGFRSYRLVKIDLTQLAREVPLFDATAHSVSISPDGKKFLFCREGEQLYRGAYHGSRASEIHLYDESKKSFETMIDEVWEARNPMWCADGNGFYYLSNVKGEFNLWLRKFDGSNDKQLSFFENESVLLPTLSKDGKVMIFRVGYKMYRFEPESSEPPREIRFTVNEIMPTVPRKEKVTGTNMAAFGDQGKRMVFSAAGDLWMMSMGDEESVRLTETDSCDEREVHISKDAKTIYYLSDQGLNVDVKTAVLGEKALSDKKIIFSNPRSKRNLQMSPDGESLSWLEATGDLVTLKLAGGEPQVVMRNWDMPTYDWSPDGNWLVVAAKDIHSNRDIWVVPSNGYRDPFNLTRHPEFEGSPKWSPDGKHMVFLGRRNRDEKMRIWLVDIPEGLVNQVKEQSVFEQMAASIKRIEMEVVDLKQVVWSEDSKSLLFQSADVNDERIYSFRLHDGKIQPYANFRGIAEGRSGSGKTYWRKNRVPVVFDGEKLYAYDFSLNVEQKRSARLRLSFRKIWRTLAERFYDKSMNGKDWSVILDKYEDVASESRNGREFDRVVAKMLGELNASHLTFHYTPWAMTKKPEKLNHATAHPGLEFGASWDGPLTIKRVIAGSPISKVEGAPVAGEIVKRLNGHHVDAGTSLSQFFNGANGQVIPLVVEGVDGKNRTLDLVPVSYEIIRVLDRKQIEGEAKSAAEAHDLVYLPFLKMKSADLERLSLEVYRASTSGKGIILDLRDNAGGRVADELLALFCQPVHTFTIPRNGPRGYPTDRRVSPAWNGPMVVISNGNTFSNAEIFCHAFKQLGRGKLVGMPTNGGVISAVDVNIPEVGKLQIPFRGWFHSETGRDLELNGAVPDVLVPLLPSDEARGNDPQLKMAIQVLEEEVKNLPKLVEPRLKSR
jgi:tricorn protease